MNKHRALEILSSIDKTRTHFSNINVSKNVWWLDIPISKIKSLYRKSLTFVLYDHRIEKLYVLNVPADFLLENIRSLSIREDRDMVSLELSSEKSSFLENVRPHASGLHFGSFLVKSVSISASQPSNPPKPISHLGLTSNLAFPVTNPNAVDGFEAECQSLFSELDALQKRIRNKVSIHADGKNLKGNELVGWLGEIYGKLLFDGTLVDDLEEHDFVTNDGLRVSVKTRKGRGLGWKQTSAIPRIEGNNCPTHLMFVHLDDDYSIDRIWLLEWQQLVTTERFKKHMVRGAQRSFIFTLNEEKDKAHVIYSKNR